MILSFQRVRDTPQPEHSGPLPQLSKHYRGIRPRLHDPTASWLNDRGKIDYATTKRGEPFKNASEMVSRKSVADLVVKLAMTGSRNSQQSGSTQSPRKGRGR
jgi:hypothetical protein